MELIIGIVVGIIIGLVVGTLIFRRRYIPVGDLRIDRSDPTSESISVSRIRHRCAHYFWHENRHAQRSQREFPPARITPPIMEPTY